MVRTPLAMLLRGQIALSFKDYWRRCTYLRLAARTVAMAGAAAATRGGGGGAVFVVCNNCRNNCNNHNINHGIIQLA